MRLRTCLSCERKGCTMPGPGCLRTCCFLAAVGAGDSARAGFRAGNFLWPNGGASPPGAVHLDRMRHHRFGFGHMDRVTGSAAESLGPSSRVPNHSRIFGQRSFTTAFFRTVLLYGVLLLVSLALDSRERLARQQTETARLNEQLSKAQLNALRRQIEPHFLFNTLNAIAGLVRERKKRCGRQHDCRVKRLSPPGAGGFQPATGTARRGIGVCAKVSGHSEGAIRRAPSGKRGVSATELLPAPVPSLILQPMVENAIKHGIAKRVHGGAIRIAALRSNGRLRLSVYNDGPRLPQDWEKTQFRNRDLQRADSPARPVWRRPLN